MRELRLPGPMRLFICAVLGFIPVFAVVPITAAVFNEGLAGIAFAAFFVFAWTWNMYWWGWHTPLAIEVSPSGDLTMKSAFGRRGTIAAGDLRSLDVWAALTPVLRHGSSRTLLLPTAPVKPLAEYLRAERPDVAVNLPDRFLR